MLRALIAVLAVTGCMAPSPPPPQPTASVPYTPTVTPSTEEPPPPPSPADWFEVLVDSFGHRIPPTGGAEFRTFSHRSQATTMYVVFHNVGEEPITSPKITFALEQREPTPERGTELATHFTGATGEGWKCSGSQGSRTCASKATVAPGEAMPIIELGVKAVEPRSTRTHFMAAYGDLLYEAVVYYDTST